jgi:BirA family biotin operon repressor/biotin-[acetyl-CoA-carboxylase] ligase
MTAQRGELGKPRIYLERTTSTMDEVARRASIAPEGLTVIAGEQTKGRGRAGRQWHAPPGSGLLFSTLLRPGCSIDVFQVFPLLAGLAVAEAIEDVTGVHALVKWPNDLLVGDRKFAGVLVTSNVAAGIVERAILGVGINISRVEDKLEEGAIALDEVANRTADSHALLDQAMMSLSAAYAQVLTDHTQALLDRWLDRAVYVGEKVKIVDGDQVHIGRYAGITPHGAIILQTCAGVYREVHSGDLVRGPVPLARHRR